MKKQDRGKESILEKTLISGLFIINKPFYPDNRGFLQEFFREDEFEIAGVSFHPVHAALSFSRPNVIRGIHTENWAKLILPLTGKMFGAYVDTRPDSPSFGKVYTRIFDNSKPRAHYPLLIPAGVGNSICVFGKEPVWYVYLNADYWEPSKARGIAWNDPDLGIEWPVKNPIVSERDRKNPRLRELYPDRFGG